LLNNFIPDNSLDAVHLYFPDPWPKNRQHKRRIVQPEFVELISSKLKPDGYIHIATDWQPYADWIKVRFDDNKRFNGGVIARPDWRPISKFEGQGLKKGHAVTDLKYKKIK
jgi:tRNA (guanine-N7-)-methyltransferase